jgi:AcrR family transcriptional regulator
VARDTPRAHIRKALIDAGAQLAGADGGAGFTIRRVADAAGTSTMAIYTHFGGIDGLRYEVRREGFAKFGVRLAGIQDSDDAVEDLSALGLVYFTYAVDESDLYRVMFLEPVLDDIDADIGWETYSVLTRGVQRCFDTGRFTDGDPEQVATQLWAMAHGTVSLHLAGLLAASDAIAALGAVALRVYTGCGDEPERAARSLQGALNRVELTEDQDPRLASNTGAGFASARSRRPSSPTPLARSAAGRPPT